MEKVQTTFEHTLFFWQKTLFLKKIDLRQALRFNAELDFPTKFRLCDIDQVSDEPSGGVRWRRAFVLF